MILDLGQKIKHSEFRQLLHYSSLSIQKTSDVLTIQQQNAKLTSDLKALNVGHNAYIRQRGTSAQLSVTTDFFVDETKAYAQLQAVDTILARQMPENMVLWPMSYLPDNIKQPSNHNTPNQAAGIRIRFVLPDVLLQRLYPQYQSHFDTYAAFKNEVYVQLAHNMTQQLYLLLYFLGATPTALTGNVGLKRSALQGQRYLEANSLKDFDNYLLALKYAATQVLPPALNAPIFLRPQAGDPEFRFGVAHLELNLVDLQPHHEDGLFEYQLQFIRLFILHALTAQPLTGDSFLATQKRFFEVAKEDPAQVSPLEDRLNNDLIGLQHFNDQVLKQARYQAVIEKLFELLHGPQNLQAAQLAAAFGEVGAYSFGLELAQKNQRILKGAPYQLRGMTQKTLETQELLASALRNGLQYRFLNEQTQTVQLTLKQHQEIVVAGSLTKANSAVTAALAANSAAQSRLLGLHQIAVLQSFMTADLAQAKADFTRMFTATPVCIYPRNHYETPHLPQIFTQPIDLATFTDAFLQASEYGDDVIVSAQLPGSIYEFYIVDGAILSVIEIIPENVVGDGQSKISELIDQKNDDDRRGSLGQKPLVRLELGEFETAFLAQQKLDGDFVPERGQQIFLSAQQTLTAGGDSLAVTDEVDESYKKLVLETAQLVDLKHGTLQWVMPNIYQAYQPNRQMAVLTQMSTAPGFAAHSFPFKGGDFDLSDTVLRQLFPELTGRPS